MCAIGRGGATGGRPEPAVLDVDDGGGTAVMLFSDRDLSSEMCRGVFEPACFKSNESFERAIMPMRACNCCFCWRWRRRRRKNTTRQMISKSTPPTTPTVTATGSTGKSLDVAAVRASNAAKREKWKHMSTLLCVCACKCMHACVCVCVHCSISYTRITIYYLHCFFE